MSRRAQQTKEARHVHALSFDEQSEESAKFAAKQKIRALDAFDQLTGGFLRNATTRGSFDSRVRYVAEEISLIADSHFDGNIDGLREAMVESWAPHEAEIPEAFREQWDKDKKKDDKPDGPPKGEGPPKDGPPKPDGPPKDDADKPPSDDEGDDGDEEDADSLGQRTITTDEAIPADTELVIKLEVAPPKESAVDWERFAALDAENARDFACAYILSKRPQRDDAELVYMTQVIGALEGFMPHVVHDDLVRTAQTIDSAYLRPSEDSDWYAVGKQAGIAATEWALSVKEGSAGVPEPLTTISIPEAFGSWEAATDQAQADYREGYIDGYHETAGIEVEAAEVETEAVVSEDDE